MSNMFYKVMLDWLMVIRGGFVLDNGVDTRWRSREKEFVGHSQEMGFMNFMTVF